MEQRKFQRFPLNCQLIIRGTDQEGQPFSEITELINISGGGALFHSSQPHLYVTGQTVEANILLPGTPDLQGAMRTSARILDVGKRINRLKDDPEAPNQVAIHFLTPFQILRDEQARQFWQYRGDVS